MDWNDYFFNIVDVVAMKSKDESTKIGCVIVGPDDHEIRTTGYNSFPRGFDDDNPKYQERPYKYKFFEHAERNAIYNASRVGTPLKGCIAYVGMWLPCTDCARAIIQAGISKVVVECGLEDMPERWREDCEESVRMFEMCGVEIEVYERHSNAILI